MEVGHFVGVFLCDLGVGTVLDEPIPKFKHAHNVMELVIEGRIAEFVQLHSVTLSHFLSPYELRK